MESEYDKTFWYSLLSAVSVLAIVGLFLYAAQLNNPAPSGIQLFSPSPFPTLSPAPMP